MNFDDWIGRERIANDVLDQARATRWLATFSLNLGQSDTSIMPQGIHFALCTPDAATENLGPDGHPARDDSSDSFLPPFPMPRRMWASSAITFHTPITVGAVIERKSRIDSIKEKEGSSGKLALVNIAHEIYADSALAASETQTVVYRDAAAPNAPLSPPASGEAAFDPSEWEAHHSLTPDPRLLFRYSALTFNTHRIHYDAPYARDVERYRGLVVHGPLTASLLLQLAARELGNNALKTFEFRGVSPAIAQEPLHLVMRSAQDGFEIGAFAGDGRQVTKAIASV